MNPPRLSIHGPSSGPVLVCALLLFTAGTVPVTAGTSDDTSNATVPDDGPAHGVDSSDFYRFWSDDVDGERVADDVDEEEVASREDAERALAKSTDIPFDHPPKASEDWTRGDFDDYTAGGSETSVAPTNAELTDGAYIKDAFVSIVGILPSTILHDGPPTNETMESGSNGSNTSHYVAPEGEVLVASDYREAVPENDDSGANREEWSFTESSVDDVVLEVDDERQDRSDGHRSRLTYEDLSGTVTLSVTATITATLDRETRECTLWVSEVDRCAGSWNRSEETVETTETVTATRTVTVNRLSSVTGSRVAFDANSDESGVVVHPNTTWSTLTVDGDARARSNWWFYTAGTPGWTNLVTHGPDGSSTSASSVRPVQVHAFPSDEEPYVPARPDNGTLPLEIEQVWGNERSGPALPPTIDLETADRYANAHSVALSSETLDDDAFHTLTVDGIVRGQSRTVSLSDQRMVREANLSLDVTAENATHATVRATVTDRETGDPVTTGRVEIGNESVPVNGTGTAVFTVQDPDLVVHAGYVPVEWWRADDPYSATSATAIASGDFDFRAFVRLVLVTILWFAPLSLLVLGLDRVTGGELLGLDRHA